MTWFHEAGLHNNRKLEQKSTKMECSCFLFSCITHVKSTTSTKHHMIQQKRELCSFFCGLSLNFHFLVKHHFCKGNHLSHVSSVASVMTDCQSEIDQKLFNGLAQNFTLTFACPGDQFCSLAAHPSSPAGKYHLTGLIVDIYGLQVTNPKAAVIVSK